MATDLLNPRQEVFVREYLTDLNATRAAIAAGYKPTAAKVTGCRMLTRGNVAVAIEKQRQERLAKLGIRADRVLEELARLGFSNMLDYIQVENGDAYIDLSKLDRQTAAAIQELTVDEYTEGRGEQAREVKRTKFKLSDKRGSLELLGKHLGLFADRVELTGADGGALAIKVAVVHIGVIIPSNGDGDGQ